VYTLGQAARATGRSKSALSRDIKAGRVSATRNPDGSLAMDPVELHRVFPRVSQGNGFGNVAWDDSQSVVAQIPNAVLLAHENEMLRAQLVDHATTIRDLRARLDASEDERRRVQERLNGLLTHRQAGSVPAVQRTVSEPRLPWWQKWFR
jgi:signal transduction protein with GAF and PtsI domain